MASAELAPGEAIPEVGTPTWDGLPLNSYLSLLDMLNPMHRLWSDGRWNKLTVAHGCYWKKCSFCDVSLDYISRYEAALDCGAEANMAKMLAADASWEAANVCVQTHGGFGFAEEYDVERKFRETRLYQVAPISTNLILSYIAEHVLDLPRSY